MLEVAVQHKAEILGLLLAISELLALIPQVKANSLAQLIFSMIKKAAGK